MVSDSIYPLGTGQVARDAVHIRVPFLAQKYDVTGLAPTSGYRLDGGKVAGDAVNHGVQGAICLHPGIAGAEPARLAGMTALPCSAA